MCAVHNWKKNSAKENETVLVIARIIKRENQEKNPGVFQHL